jgi:uncharacterized SAM-binding protein YcdF (DUF218 family)
MVDIQVQKSSYFGYGANFIYTMKVFISPLLFFLALNGFVVLLHWRNYKRYLTKYRFILCFFSLVYLFLWILALPYVASLLRINIEQSVTYEEIKSLEDIDVVVILAAGLRKYKDFNEDELVAPYRVIKGVRVFKKTGARLLIMSGGSGIKGESRMVITMKKLATELDVPDGRIILEPMSRNTLEHVKFICKMQEVRTTDRIGLVTSASHMPRALKEFKRKFPNVVPIACEKKIGAPTGFSAWLPNVSALYTSTRIIQEYVGTGWYWMRHFVDRNISGRL